MNIVTVWNFLRRNQKNIGTNTKDNSWKVCKAAKDEQMLSKKYDKLFGQEDKK